MVAASESTNRARVWPPIVALAALALILVHVWWLHEFRDGYPLNIDEAGYLSLALDYASAYEQRGLQGLLHTFRHLGGIQAPLLPLVTVPIVVVVGREITVSFLAVQGFFALLFVSSYGIGSRLASRSIGFLTAVVVAGIPAVTEFTRQYHFAVPSAALFTASTYALLTSNGLSRRGWVLAWGFTLGLSTLARTVTLALVPGIVLAAIVQLVFSPRHRSGRVLNFGFGVSLAAATAFSWYGPNYSEIFAYLTSYGYGEPSTYFGTSFGIATLEFWTARLRETIVDGVHVPLAGILLVSLLAGVVQILRQWKRRSGARGTVAAALRSDRGVLVLIVTAGYLALTSSRNEGTGFFLPLLPMVVALATGSLGYPTAAGLRPILVCAFAAVACVNLAINAPVVGPTAFGLVEGMGFRVSGGIRRYLEDAGYDLGTSTSQLPSVHRAWQMLDRQVAAYAIDLATAHGRQPYVVFASQNRLFNTNSVGLMGRVALDSRIDFGQLQSIKHGDSIPAYRRSLASTLQNILVTVDPSPGDFQPSVTQAYCESAARSLGFQFVKSFRLPDGREARVWWLDRGRPAIQRLQ